MKHARSFLVFVVCAVSLTAGNARAQTQLVTNETFNSPPGGSKTTLSASSTTLTGWTVDYTAPQNNGIAFGTSFGTPGLASTQSVQLASGSIGSFAEGGIQQTIATIPGQAYAITIEAKDEKNVINSTGGTVSFGGQTHTLASLSESWTGFSWTETATGSSTLLDVIGNSSKLDAVVVSDLSLTLTQVPTVWSGSSSTDWGTAANWGSNYVPNNSGVAVTFGTAGANHTVDIGAASRTVGVLNFLKTVPTTITSSSGNYLILDDTGGSSASAAINVSGSHTISAPIEFNGPVAVNISSGTDQLVVSGVVADGINGSQGLSLSGSGTLSLAAANTFSGATNAASGTLLLSKNAALQNSTLSNTGAVAFAGGITSPTLGGLSGNGNFGLATTSGQSVALSVGNNGQSTTYGGVLSGGGSLTKIGSGGLTLTGANTFSGNTLISGGTLAVGNPAALQNSVLDTSGGGFLSFGSQTLATVGGLINGGGLNLVNAASQPVNLTLGVNGQNLTYPGAITGAGGSVTMNGAAMQVLSGNNTYGGGSNVTAGTLQFQGSGALPAGTIGGGGNGVFSLRVDGVGNGGTINVPDNITLTVAGATNGLTIDVGSLSGGHTGTTVSFGTLSNGTPANALNSGINFTAANGYLESLAGLNLPGANGYSTVLNPTTTTVAILGNVANQMTTFSGVQYDTLVLDGTSAGNTIYGAITDAPNSLGVGFGDTRITKSNSSQWVLAGTNTFSGPTVITGGTLQLGTGRSGQDGTLYSAANINSVSNNAALVYDIVGNQTALYSIGGSGALSMIGPGSVTLAASNSYTGATNISRGTLTVGPAGSIAQSPTIFLSGGATFDVSQVYFQLAAGQSLAGTGNYTVNGAMTADSGATIQPGASASAGTLNVGGLTLSPGSSLSYDLGLGRGQNLINVGSAFGGLTLNGGGVALTQPNGSTFGTPGTYLLMNYGSGNSVAGSPSNLSVLNPTASNTYSFTATGGSLDVTIGAPNVWNGGANPSFVWSKASNWSTGQAPANNNSIMFAGTTGLSNINDIGGLGLTAVFFSPSAGAFNISGNPIQLGGPIINSSTAAQTIGLNITLTGGTQNVNAAAGNIVLNGVIDDAGAGLGINIIGPHTVILGGANTYSGTTSAAGPLRLANPLALQNSTLNLLPGGSLTFAASSTSVSIAGLGGNGSIALTTSTGQPVALGVGGTNLSSIFGGTLSGNGSLIKQGNGTFTLAAPQTYGGATLVTGGVLQLVPAIAIAGFGANTTGATFTGDNGAWQFNSNGAAYTATPVTGGVLTLTQSTVGNSARSAFYNNPAPVQAFNASFVYKDASVNGADGVTFMLQSQGLTALGYPGGAWGYTGATLTSPGITSSVGISMNIYSGAPGGSSSVNLLEGGIVTSTAGISTSPVNIDDGDPISVSLSYDGFNNLTLSLSDTTAGTSYTKTFAGVNFAALIGSNNAYVGFSGADGGVNSTQLISNFSFKSPPNGGGGLPSNSPVTISNGSTLDMTNYQQTILSLSSTDGMGSQVLLGNGALTIANTAAGTTFDGTIAGAGGTLIVQGGKFTLTGPNTYSGVTEIVGGGTLQLATGPTGQDGSIDTTSLVSDFGTVVYNVADNRTIAYPVTGPGSLVQAGTGVLTLTATNSYIGATTIGGGTLQLGAGMAGEDGSIAGARVIDNGTLVYNLYGGESPAYVISGSGSLVLTGGTLTLSGTNSYSGGTIVESGMLVLSDNAAIADGTSLAVGDPAFFFGPAAAAGGGSAAPLTESQAATVPEPPTLALAAAAGAVLSALFRKHRRR